MLVDTICTTVRELWPRSKWTEAEWVAFIDGFRSLERSSVSDDQVRACLCEQRRMSAFPSPQMDRLTKALRALDHRGMSATLSPVATSEACTEEEAAAVRERARAWWSGLDAYARERACDRFASRNPGYGKLMGPITAYSADRSMLQQCVLYGCERKERFS